MTRNGIATNVSAMTAPGRRERELDAEPVVEVLPDEAVAAERVEAARHHRRPAAAPSGATRAHATSARPGNSTRASTHASGTPNSTESAVAHSEHTTESRSAAVASGSSEVGPEVAPGDLANQADQRERDEREPDERNEYREPRDSVAPCAHGAGRNPNELQRLLARRPT